MSSTVVEPARDLKEDAIGIWEKGVTKERDGSMTDAIKYYRKALQLDESVEKHYRKKLHTEWELQKKLQQLKVSLDVGEEDTGEKTAPEQDTEPCLLLDMLPNDVLLRIVNHVVQMSGEAWFNLSTTCSRLNKLCFSDSSTYKTFAQYIYPKQKYAGVGTDLNGINNVALVVARFWDKDYQKMLKERPYIKFEGVYISVVNYLRYGANAEGSSSFTNPIHMITYYRYFRFYPDGRCLRLLTTDEPLQVIKNFSIETKPYYADICNWSLSLEEGLSDITITRDNEEYKFVERLKIRNHGAKRHQRLKWLQSTVTNRFGETTQVSLRNEKPFSFSRVKSYSN